MEALSFQQTVKLIEAQDKIIYNLLSATMLSLWDYCLTLDQEKQYIWDQKPGIKTLLYVVLRYLLFGHRLVQLLVNTSNENLIFLSTTFCQNYTRLSAAVGPIIAFSLEVVLILRVYAYWNSKKTLLWVLLLLFAAEQISRVVIISLAVPPSVDLPSPFPANLHIARCLPRRAKLGTLFNNYWYTFLLPLDQSHGSNFEISRIPGLLFDTILFALVLVKYVSLWRASGGHVRSSPIYTVIMRDGLWVYVVMLAANLWCTFSFELAEVSGDVALQWMYTSVSLCGCRVILNLGRTVTAGSSSLMSNTISNLEFGDARRQDPEADNVELDGLPHALPHSQGQAAAPP